MVSDDQKEDHSAEENWIVKVCRDTNPCGHHYGKKPGSGRDDVS